MKHIDQASSARRAAYEHVALSLAMQYDTIYYIDLRDERYIVFSSTDDYKSLELPPDGERYFERMKARIRSLIHEGDEAVIQGMVEREDLLGTLAHSYSKDATFRVRFQNRYIYMNMRVMRAEDRQHMIATFKDVDAIERRRIEEERRARIYSDIARTLARKYDHIYHLDLDLHTCMRFDANISHTEPVSEMSLDTFFEEIREFHVHREDRQLMKIMESAESLAEAVEQQDRLVFTVRLKQEHRYVYTRFCGMWADDHRHIIVAVYDVDEKVRSMRAQAQILRDAEKRAMMDDLTRVRNKNAYADLEEELQRSIDEGTAEPLAIAVCDVNNLKGVNDDQGHKAGDALLQTACKLICVVYAHSPVFRVGGDEFAVVIRGEDYRNRHALLQKMRDTAAENLHNGGAVVAVGMSDYDGDDFISDVFERADQDMYENKRALKSAYNNDGGDRR